MLSYMLSRITFRINNDTNRIGTYTGRSMQRERFRLNFMIVCARESLLLTHNASHDSADLN